MKSQTSTLLSRWRRDERGGIVLFVATIAPLLIIMGGAVDFARFSRYKTALANTIDAAAIALASAHDDYTSEQATAFVTDYVASSSVTDSAFTVTSIAVTTTENGFRILADASMETVFLPRGWARVNDQGDPAMDTSLVSEVVNSSTRLELALVVDNTGSMNCGATLATSCVNNWSAPAASSRIKSVKSAAKLLVDILMSEDLNDKDQVKIALVPFEGHVNVASAGFSVTSPPAWIDWGDQAGAKWNGANFAQHDFGGIIGPRTVGHGWLFNNLTDNFPTVKWAGCVEMRAGAYELTDDAPNTALPNSLFVPFFHPDEPDSTATTSGATRYNNRSNGTSSGTNYTFTNNYLNDGAAFTTPAAAQKSLDKYTAATPAFWSGRMDVEGLLTPYEYGPNKGCPRPIYPLANANSKAAIKAEIDAMIAYWSTGTFIPTGLVWGWHALSPGEPYTEGTKPSDEHYEKTVKAIVLFTDGENDITDDGNPNRSRYHGYSYVTTNVGGTYRLASTAAGAEAALNTKTATLCSNVKTAEIRLYVVTFGTMSGASTTLMQNCATVDEGKRLYYNAPTTADLESIFEEIAKDLTNVHISR